MTAHAMTAPSPTDDSGADPESRDLTDSPPLDAEAALWLARRLDGLTPAEDAELRAWLAGDPARGARLEQLAGVWGQLGELPAADIAKLRAACCAAPTPLPEHALPPQTPPRDRMSARPEPRPRAAAWQGLMPQWVMAGLIALVVMGGGWLGWNHWQQQPTFTQNLVTERGQQLIATLPDGSRLRLDTATRLEVRLYRQQREVRLAEGQALFEVQADPQRPFHVVAGALRITVLGTRFSVRHSPQGSVGVTVEEGRVRVTRAAPSSAPGAAPAAAAGIVLTAGQRVQADARGQPGAVVRIDPRNELAWREGRVVFEGTPLAEAIAEIERYVDTGLVIDDPAVAALRLNGSFDLRRAHTFRQVLPRALPVRLLARADGKTKIVAAH